MVDEDTLFDFFWLSNLLRILGKDLLMCLIDQHIGQLTLILSGLFGV